MMVAIQYDFFEEKSDLNDLKKEVTEIRKSADNVRRGIFARHGELMKLILKQQQEIEELKDWINGQRNRKLLSKNAHRSDAEVETEFAICK